MGLKRVSWVRRYQGQCRALRPLGHQGCRLRNHKKDQPLCSGYKESKEEEEEEAQVSEGKAAKKVAAKPRSEETRARAPFKQPACQSQPRGEPAKPPPKGKTSVAKALGSKMQTVPKKK